MAKVFFSYASEDSAVVDAIYLAVIEQFPEHEPWIDKYDIVGGESLIGKIAEGMDAAERFFVFLSPASVQKPWVERELRRAILREIEGVDPRFVVPVKIGDLERFPAFLEDKLYIDLTKLKKEEWLSAFNAAITGVPTRPGTGSLDNIRSWSEYGPQGTHVALVYFEARAWVEQFAFGVHTSEDVIASTIAGGGAFTNIRRLEEPRRVAYAFGTPELRPGRPIAILLQFAEGVDARAAIRDVFHAPP